MNSALKNLLRPHYIDLQGYVSAGMEVEKSESLIFLNANENPYELPGLETFNRYPEPQPKALAAAYANAYGVNADQIVMTRGADEAIVILTKLFCEPRKDTILICPPTFGMYGVNANAMPADILKIPLKKENGTFTLDKTAIIKAAYNRQNNLKLVYICSPNNPTGTSFPHTDIAEICTETEGQAVVILDETYAEFSAQGSMAPRLNDHPNLIILRTLSKSYAMAGMRMGCFISGDTDFIALVKSKALDAYPLPRASVEAATHVLSPEISATAKENIRKLLDERERIKTALEKSDKITHVYPSDANFLLVEMNNASDFIKFAAENNVILRDFSTKPGTENCIRISIGTPEQNDLVLKLLNGFKP
ncbi:MAG: histidinol-phosphate transaminase [Alphaproteobacteria bacterium]